MERKIWLWILSLTVLLISIVVLNISTPDKIQAQANSTPTPADLHINKLGAPNPVTAGQPLTYTIVVTNTGAAAAQNVVIKDLLPAGVTFNGAWHVRMLDGVGASVVVSNYALTGTITLLNPGGIVTITAQTLVDTAASGSSIVNSASVTTTTSLVAGNHVASVTTHLITPTPTPNAADLQISKRSAPNQVTAGQLLTYTIIVTNTGPSVAQNVLIQDLLPTSVKFNGASAIAVLNGTNPHLSLTSSALTGTVDSLNVGGIITITGRALVNANAAGATLLNTASVTTTTDLIPSNNVASVTTNLITATPTNTPTPTPNTADLRISKTSAPNPVVAGQVLTYTIVVTNTGPSAAQNVIVKDLLPAGVNFNGTSRISLVNGVNPNLILAGGALTGTVGTLNVGGVFTIWGRTLVSANAMGASLLNTASVTTTNDLLPSNNIASTTTTLLTATPTNPPTPTAANTPTPTSTPTNTPTSTPTFTSTPTATSIANATATTISTPTSAATLVPTPTATPIVTNTPDATATATSLPSNTATSTSTPTQTATQTPISTATPTITLLPTATATPLTTATPTLAPTSTATFTPTVPNQADLRISKRAAPNPVKAGEPLTYTIVITNTGPSAAQNVVINDQLPANVNFAGNSSIHVTNGTGAHLDLTSTTLAGTVATLNVGGVVTITSQTLVTLSATGTTIQNSASVTTTTDNNPSNNTGSALVDLITATPTNTPTPTATPTNTSMPTATQTPTPPPPTATITPTPAQANLQISISSDPKEIIAGQPLTYTIMVTNVGGSPARNVVVRDILPAGVTLQGQTFIHMQNGTEGNLVVDNHVVTATATVLEAGGVIWVTIQARVNPGLAEPTLLNTANLAADGDNAPLSGIASITTPLLTPPKSERAIFLPVITK